MAATKWILPLTATLVAVTLVGASPQSNSGNGQACCTVNGQTRCFQQGSASYFATCNGNSDGSFSGSGDQACCNINGIRSCYPQGSAGYSRCTTGANPSPGCCRIGGADYRCYDDGTEGYNICRNMNQGNNGGSGNGCCTINGLYNCYSPNTPGYYRCQSENGGNGYGYGYGYGYNGRNNWFNNEWDNIWRPGNIIRNIFGWF